MSATDGNHADSHADDASHGPPPPPEPQTPLWLPALGAFLFLIVGLAWALSSPPAEVTESPANPAQTAAPEAGTPPPPAPDGHGHAPDGHGHDGHGHAH
jgi:hypothetical protein